MKPLLKLSNIIDAFNNRIGQGLMWLILAAVLISAGNAFIRKLFNVSSNAFLEVQWYLFAAVFMLGAGYTFLKNAHVRIDFVSSRLSAKTRNWIDIIGIILFLVPLCYLLITLGWPLFVNAYQSGEMSQNAGGLIRWPAYMMIPVGMGLLLLQGFSELIKRSAYLSGHIDDPLAHNDNPEEEELKQLEEELLTRANDTAGGKA
jgi:TRAP-type mannitol/chloroaromatic compound transport system permease small subunit